ncbi:STM3941 family protein [Reyranella sp.]|uniref:STM3941 family protein n=1 Tax=Reyranella sp. TaxID=1929291 RepID=UPI0040371BCF
MTPELSVPISRSKVGFLAIASLAMAVAAGWMLLAAPGVGSNSFHQLVLGFGVFFFLLLGWAHLRTLSGKEPGLVINRQGFLFRPTGLAFGWVDWADVSEIREGLGRGGAFLSIRLRDPQKYIARGNGLQRLAKSINWRLAGSPVTFTSGSLQADPAELLRVIRLYFSEAKRAEAGALSSGPPPM